MQAGDYVDIGKYLRDVRENLNLTTEQAARALHIRAQYISKLEAGDLNDMPPRVYVRGYIKNYAEFLGLDSGKVLSEYERLFGGDTHKFFVPENNRNRSAPSHNTLWFCILGLIFLYVYWYLTAYDRTTIKNSVPELPVDYAAYNTDLMEEDWKHCLSDYSILCFVELQEKNSAAKPFIQLPVLLPSLQQQTDKKDDNSDSED